MWNATNRGGGTGNTMSQSQTSRRTVMKIAAAGAPSAMRAQQAAGRDAMLRKMLEPPSRKVRAVTDTDMHNEIDDQYAVAYGMLSPDRMEVEAVYAAPYRNSRSNSAGDGMEKSDQEILRLLKFLKKKKARRGSQVVRQRSATPLFAGSLPARASIRFLILLLMVRSFPMCAQLAFREQTLAEGLNGGYQVTAVDVNGDGRTDLIALATGMKELLWFENPGWKKHVLLAPVDRPINLAARDIDGDGIPEIVLAAGWSTLAGKSPGTVWLVKRRGDPRQPWEATEIDRLPTSHRIRAANIDGPAFVNAPLIAADAQAPDYRGATPLVYYKPPDWKRRLISSENQGVVHGLEVLDWDGDGRDDILTASFEGIHWFTRSPQGAWKRERIAAGDPSPWPKSGSSDVAVGRAGGARFLAAIEPWHGHQVVIYRQNRQGWQRSVIDDSNRDLHALRTGDLDGDGNDEVVAAVRGAPHRVLLYRYEGGRWERHTLDDGGMAAADCAIADLDGDGRLDVACIGSATANLKIYLNQGR